MGGHNDCIGAWGPWTPPEPVPVHEELTYQHVYVNPGHFFFRSRQVPGSSVANYLTREGETTLGAHRPRTAWDPQLGRTPDNG